MTDFGNLLDAGADQTYASTLNPNYRANPGIPADQAPMGSGGTHVDAIFSEISAKIVSVGDGSGATKAQPFVFFISDGMLDSQWYSASNGWHDNPGSPWPYPTAPGKLPSIRAMDPSWCTALKARGVTLSVLEIPYPAFPSPTNYASSEDFKVNDAVPNLDNAMKSCASPGFYYKANTPADITAAMQAMFQQAVQSARLTQ